MTAIAPHTTSGPAMVASTRPLSRSQRLMQATGGAHDRLDDQIISAKPSRTRDHYIRLLTVQYRFHRATDGLYIRALTLPASLEIPTRRRLDRVRQDLVDLGGSATVHEDPEPLDASRIEPAAAIGWLWVAEGSTLGAASLLQRAAALGLPSTNRSIEMALGQMLSGSTPISLARKVLVAEGSQMPCPLQ